MVGAHDGLFDALADHAPVGVFVCDADGAFVYANERLCQSVALTAEQLLGHGWAQALHPEDAARVRAAWADASACGRDFHAEYRLMRPDGGVRFVQSSAAAVHDSEGVLLGWVGCCVDLTAPEFSDRRYRELVEKATDAIFTANMKGEIVELNRSGESLTGYDRAELLGMSMFDLIAPEDRQRGRETFRLRLAGGETAIPEYQIIRKDGVRVFVELAGRSLEKDGRLVGIEAIVRDTSERHALEEKLRHEALHDALTGLPNRTLFHDRLAQALARTARSGSNVAVMLLDLDGFKLVNDGFGHDVGDELLVKLAPRLRHVLRASDTVARLGGDEFGLLVEDFVREQELFAMAERLLAAVAEPPPIDRAELQITASLGIAIAEPGDTAETALSNADTAMYKAKNAGKGGFEVYNDAMRERLQRELTLAKALMLALRDGRIEVNYQPIFSLANGRMIALEALARWDDPELGSIEPAEFIPIAQEHGLIVQLGQQVLGEVARHAADWRAECPNALPLGVFVNISPRELSQPGFVETFIQTLERNGSTTTDVGIEITERVLIDEANATLTGNLIRLTQLGVRLVLDDFGTGYSSLTALKQLPLTAVKIDRSFTKPILSSSDTAPVSSATISLGHTLGLTVIAEGVETELQAALLAGLGCDAAQGFHFARPTSAEQTTALLEAETRQARRATRAGLAEQGGR